jgi:hypothetical protein
MRPELESIPSYYRTYVALVAESDPVEAVRESMECMQALVRRLPEDKAGHRYAVGKWSVQEVLCHLMDGERVFAYRALRFARGDRTPLPGYDQDLYAPQANAAARALERLADEMLRLRASTIDLFASFTPEMLARSGEANQNILSVLALGFIIAGHERHHLKVLEERYL